MKHEKGTTKYHCGITFQGSFIHSRLFFGEIFLRSLFRNINIIIVVKGEREVEQIKIDISDVEWLRAEPT
jgi:uncharacterized secreted protein with C-terminal beta-propeller domain